MATLVNDTCKSFIKLTPGYLMIHNDLSEGMSY